MYTPFKFYTSKVCPFAQRVSITLNELGMLNTIEPGTHGQVELHEIDLKNEPKWFTEQINTLGKVPVLQITLKDNSVHNLVESARITDFLLQLKEDQKHKLNAFDRYMASAISDTFNESVVDPFYTLLKEQDTSKRVQVQKALLSGILNVQAMLSTTGPFALGSEMSVADILTAPFHVRFSVIEHYRQFKVPQTNEYARFNQWHKVLMDRPSIKATSASSEFYIEAYKSYALPA